jgi:hypothetical protein
MSSIGLPSSAAGARLPVCRTCGVQYGEARVDCPVCLDERQYVNWEGQQWTSLAELHSGGHRGKIEEEGPGVIGIGAVPSVGVGQRALLIQSGSTPSSPRSICGA